MANQVHSTAIIEGQVDMGDGNVVGPYSVIYGPLTMGDDNCISPHVTIGTPGQDTRNPRYDSSTSAIVIGSRNIVREFATIQKPCYRDATVLGDDVFVMHGAHIPHDAKLDDGVVVTPSCVVGGLAHLMRHATIGMGATIHQYTVVGPYSMVATGAAVIKNVRPFSRYIPHHPVSVNDYAVRKYGYENLATQIRAYVLEGAAPADPGLAGLVSEYERAHRASGRREY